MGKLKLPTFSKRRLLAVKLDSRSLVSQETTMGATAFETAKNKLTGVFAKVLKSVESYTD